MTEIGFGTTEDVVTKKMSDFLQSVIELAKTRSHVKRLKISLKSKKSLNLKMILRQKMRGHLKANSADLDRAEDETTFDIESNDPEEIEDDDEEKEE